MNLELLFGCCDGELIEAEIIIAEELVRITSVKITPSSRLFRHPLSSYHSRKIIHSTPFSHELEM